MKIFNKIPCNFKKFSIAAGFIHLNIDIQQIEQTNFFGKFPLGVTVFELILKNPSLQGDHRKAAPPPGGCSPSWDLRPPKYFLQLVIKLSKQEDLEIYIAV